MQRITSLDDPRTAEYRNLRDRALRGENLFIAEGDLVVRRLLESEYEVESLFVSDEQAERFAAADIAMRVYVADRKLMVDIVGFPFHRGVMAIGRRRPPVAIESVMNDLEANARLTFLVCPETAQAENLGMVFRSAAAFGVDAVLLGPKTCDPLCRRALRVSMGGSLCLPLVRSENLAEDLRTLRSRWGMRIAAAVLADDAELLPEVDWPPRVGLMLGNEFDGLSDEWLALCDQKITIPMAPGSDSLNLGVAASVFIYERMRSTLKRDRCNP
jgi:tRNA G18 (ribose-2'-O)-methylase SpoU